MKNRIFTVVFAVLFVLVAVPAMAQQEVLTNEKVIKMIKAGVKQEIVVALIRDSNSNFDLTSDGIIGLTSSGVPADVIALMMETSRPSKPQAAFKPQKFDSFAAAIKALDGSVIIGEVSPHDPYRNLNDQSGSYPNAAADVAYDRARAIERERIKAVRYRNGYGGSYPYGRGPVYWPSGNQGNVANQGPDYSDLNPAQVLSEEIGSELKSAIYKMGGHLTTNETAPYRLVARYSIADETITQKGFDAGAIVYTTLFYGRGFRGDIWDLLLLTGAQIGKNEQRREVQGVLYLEIRDKEGNVVYFTRGSTDDKHGTLNTLEAKNKQLGPYYSDKRRFTNAHFLAEIMVAAAVAQ